MCPLVSVNPIPLTGIFPHVKSPITDPITEMGLTDTFGLYVAYPMPCLYILLIMVVKYSGEGYKISLL
jgi:hypothetical protein